MCVSLQYNYKLLILHVYRELNQLRMFVPIQNLQLRGARTSTVDLSLPLKNQQWASKIDLNEFNEQTRRNTILDTVTMISESLAFIQVSPKNPTWLSGF